MTGRITRGALALALATTGLAACLASPALAATSTSSSETYGPGGDVATQCDDALSAGGTQYGAGGGCFTPAAGATTVQAALADAQSTNTAGEIQFQNASGKMVGTWGFCGQSVQVTIPAGTAAIFVVADGPLLANLAEGCGTTSFGTTGTVTLTQFFPTL